MTAFRASGSGRKDRENPIGQACLLRSDEKTSGRTPGMPREARGARCVLTQSRPLRAALACEKIGAPRATGVYDHGPRITCVDRAIMRAYFHPYEAGTQARSEKSAGIASSSTGYEENEAGLLPVELESKLTPLPAGYLRVLRGNDVYLVHVGTHEIVDSAHNVSVG